MKKIIFSLLCIMMLCTTVTFAAENETVGGTITLTQFLGASREDVKSVAITTNAKTDYVDKNAFYDISDGLMLTSTFEPEFNHNRWYIYNSRKNRRKFFVCVYRTKRRR